MSPRRKIWSASVLGVLLLAGGAWGWKFTQERARLSAAIPARPELSGWPKEFAAALDSAESAARRASQQAAGLARLSQLYQANGFHNQAAACYRRLLTLEPAEARWPHLLANILAGFGELEEALPLQQKAVSLAPGNLVCQLRLGDMQLKNNRPDLAAATYAVALQLDPANPYALLGLARCDLAGGNWTGARARLLESVKHQPRFPGVWDLLATVHEHLGEKVPAEGSRRAAALVGKYRDLPDPWLNSALEDCFDAYQLSVAAALTADRAEARRRLERAILLAPASSDYHRQLAKLLTKAGDYAAARQQLETAVDAVPTDAESWSALLDLLLGIKDMPASRAALARALSLCPQSAYLHFINGLQQAGLDRPEEAAEAFRTSIKLQPNEARAYIQLSAIYVRQGRVAEALAAMKAAQAAEPGNTAIVVLLIRLCIVAEDEPGARHWLETVHQRTDAVTEDVTATEKLYREQFGHEPP